jgi:DNA-binding CsgD family transcriptional regulator
MNVETVFVRDAVRRCCLRTSPAAGVLHARSRHGPASEAAGEESCVLLCGFWRSVAPGLTLACEVSVFVGRTGQLRALAEVVATARSGATAAIVIGEPGSGKSRLLAEAQQRVALPKCLAISGFEPERRIPLAAAASLLRTLAEVPGHGARLETLLFRPKEAAVLEPVRLFEAAHRAFRTLKHALLVIDDLQWMDDLSYALCHYLIRAARESRQRVAIFAASRPGERGAELADALPDERITMVELTPLTLEEGIDLALSIDADLDRARASQLWEAAQGSPFWLEALARARGVAGGLGQLLTVRLRGAGSDAGALLGLLAVAGRPVPGSDVAALLEWQPGRAEAALGELVGRGVAIESGGVAHLAHDLIRDAALANLPEDSRRRIHSRLAGQLELRAGDDLRLLREALEHRRAAQTPALELARRLARSPRRRLLGPDGLRLLASIADEADPLDAETLALHEEVASLASELAEHEEALACWSLVAERAELPVGRALALLAASRAAYGLARAAEAREFLAASMEVEADDEVLRLEQHTHEAAILLWLEQRTTEGRVLAGEAVAAAAGLASGAGGVAALDARARRAYIDAIRVDYEVAMQEGDPGSLLRAAEAREAAARGFELEADLTASLALGVALLQNGRVREAVARHRRVWSEAQRRVLPRLAVDSGFWLARSLEHAGELSEAERVVRKASEVATRAGDVPRARHRVARVASSIALQRGRPRDALRRLERETAEEPNEHQRIMLHADIALWYGRLDGPAAAASAQQQLSKGRACADAVGCQRCAADLVLFSAEALARIGEREQARQALSRWESLGVRPDALDEFLRLHARSLAEVDAAARAAALDAALGAAESSAYGLVSLWIRLDLGRELAAAGEERAVAELERVAAVARERGAETVLELADQALRALGVRTWRRGAAGAPLTERELEIARLVSGGATNREIAETLFLSPKTVERHVSNALKKLGARNRTELGERLRGGAAEYAGNAR